MRASYAERVRVAGIVPFRASSNRRLSWWSGLRPQAVCASPLSRSERDAWTKANATAKRRLLQRRGERACVPVMQSACAPPASCLSGLRRTAGSSGGQDCPASRLWQPLFPFGEGDTWTKANARAKRRLLQRSGEWACAPVMQSACASPVSYLSGLHRTAGSASGQDCAHKPPVVAPFPLGEGEAWTKANATAKLLLLQCLGEWACAPVMQSACAPPVSYLLGLRQIAGSASGQDCARKPPAAGTWRCLRVRDAPVRCFANAFAAQRASAFCLAKAGSFSPLTAIKSPAPAGRR